MGINDFSKNLKLMLSEIAEFNRSAALTSALDGIALIRKRVQTDRKTVDGSSFGTYNPTYFKYKKQKLSSNSNINWTATGRTMSDLAPVITKDNGVEVEVTMKPKTAIYVERLGFLEALQKRKSRDPRIIELSKQELEIVLEIYLEEYFEFLKKYNMVK